MFTKVVNTFDDPNIFPLNVLYARLAIRVETSRIIKPTWTKHDATRPVSRSYWLLTSSESTPWIWKMARKSTLRSSYILDEIFEVEGCCGTDGYIWRRLRFALLIYFKDIIAVPQEQYKIQLIMKRCSRMPKVSASIGSSMSPGWWSSKTVGGSAGTEIEDEVVDKQ